MTYPVLAITSETTPQEVLDAVANHLKRQGKPSLGHGDSHESMLCKYRSGELACAVGCLLTDEEAAFLDSQSNISIYSLRDNGLLPQRLMPHFNLLAELQYTHDREPAQYWPELLMEILA